MSKQKIFLLTLLLSFILAACGAKAAPQAIEATATTALTSTPDPCSSENMPAEVKKIHDLMREFDDYATLASNTPQTQIIQLIPDMQRVFRDAQDQTVPACLENLKKLQVMNMAIVVQTLMTFLSATDSVSAEKINSGITQAREMHNQYDIERARLLGITLAPPPTAMPTSAATATPKP